MTDTREGPAGPRTASLPMYAVPRDALDGFWSGVRRHLLTAGVADVPMALAAPGELMAHWTTPELLLSQSCGFPLTHGLKGQVRLVGTPCYDAFGCSGPFYTSLFLVRADDPAAHLADLRGRRVAFNGTDSQSGYNVLRAAVAPLAKAGRFFAATLATGAHRRSMASVLSGEADVAAVDCVTFALAAREPVDATRGLRILCVSDPAPGLPLITAAGTSEEDLARLRRGFAAACADPSLAAPRRAMLLSGFEILPLEAYDVLPALAARAKALGYPEIS